MIRQGTEQRRILKHTLKNTRSKEQDEILHEFNLILQAVILLKTDINKKCSVSEALEYLKQFDYSITTQQETKNNHSKSSYHIFKINEVEHPSLISYLKSRKLDSVKSTLQEIHYELNGRNYFGIGFKNDSEGYEIRNPWIKICLGKKDITTIGNNSNTLRIFEGFTDYLSFKCLEKILEKEPSDYLILNSVSMISKIQNSLEKYKNIELYLDNDRAGNFATQQLMTFSENIKDERLLYQNHKDLNEYLVNHEMKKIMWS